MPSLSPRLWAYIGTGVLVLSLLFALQHTRMTLASVKAERDVAVTKLSVSNASVGRLEAEMDRVLTEQKALADSDANRISASRQALQIAAAAEEARQAVIDRLKASAEIVRSDSQMCEVSDEVARLWPAN